MAYKIKNICFILMMNFMVYNALPAVANSQEEVLQFYIDRAPPYEPIELSYPGRFDVSEFYPQSLDTKSCGPVFVMTNELKYQEVKEQLELRNHSDKTKDRVLVGVSGPDLLNTALATEAQHIIVVDSSPKVIVFWRHLRALIGKHSDPKSLVIDLVALLEKNPHWSVGLKGSVSEVIKQYRSCLEKEDWLASPINYQKIRALVLRGDLFICHVDISQKEKMESLAQFIKEQGWTTHTVYLSNAISWIKRSDDFKSNMQESLRFALRALLMDSDYAVDPDNDHIKVIYAWRPGRSFFLDGKVEALMYRSPLITQSERCLTGVKNFMDCVFPKLCLPACDDLKESQISTSDL